MVEKKWSWGWWRSAAACGFRIASRFATDTVMRASRAAARPGLLVVLMVALVPLFVVVLQPAPKATGIITVNTLNDETTPGDGDCSLREAINNANAAGDTTGGDCVAGTGNDTIVFSVSGTIALQSTLPAIQNNLIIDGSGQTVTVDGGGQYGVMVVSSSGTLVLANLTIADGNATYGGGIYNQDGTLGVANVTFLENSAQWGGAISNGIFGNLTVSGCTFSGNQAQYAGAIYNAGAMEPQTITDSTFA
ncbi:MAG TPA: CSLREA domain-containing protein, partial [Candidatus Binataceae bacterium]|nr:CSLREA domain-containing protein [Candidatus Binataceae bacterium]